MTRPFEMTVILGVVDFVTGVVTVGLLLRRRRPSSEMAWLRKAGRIICKNSTHSVAPDTDISLQWDRPLSIPDRSGRESRNRRGVQPSK